MTQDPFGLASRPAIGFNLVQTDRQKLIVLERIEDNPEPVDYCVHGRTKCFGCDRWCHLGPETFEVVNSGSATPYCMQCATPLVQDPRLYIGSYDDRKHS
jgi:hypothetical protein